MPEGYINSYHPMITTGRGRANCAKYNIQPFVDGSIRREPDLEHPQPSITCLCRAGKFAPRLCVGDIVAYVTVKQRYGDVPFRHRRLTAVLRVERIFASHDVAAAWYRDHGHRLPSNCMVRENPPMPLDHSNEGHKWKDSCAPNVREWDLGYWARARANGIFVSCSALFIDLSLNAPVIGESHFERAFGKVPGTRNPGQVPLGQLQSFLSSLEVSVPPFDL